MEHFLPEVEVGPSLCLPHSITHQPRLPLLTSVQQLFSYYAIAFSERTLLDESLFVELFLQFFGVEFRKGYSASCSLTVA